eukprot:jgi/Bigna1/140191/aug1.54_g14899
MDATGFPCLLSFRHSGDSVLSYGGIGDKGGGQPKGRMPFFFFFFHLQRRKDRLCRSKVIIVFKAAIKSIIGAAWKKRRQLKARRWLVSGNILNARSPDYNSDDQNMKGEKDTENGNHDGLNTSENDKSDDNNRYQDGDKDNKRGNVNMPSKISQIKASVAEKWSSNVNGENLKKTKVYLSERIDKTKDIVSIQKLQDNVKPRLGQLKEFLSESSDAPWAIPFGVTAAMASLAIWGASGGNIYSSRSVGGGGGGGAGDGDYSHGTTFYEYGGEGGGSNPFMKSSQDDDDDEEEQHGKLSDNNVKETTAVATASGAAGERAGNDLTKMDDEGGMSSSSASSSNIARTVTQADGSDIAAGVIADTAGNVFGQVLLAQDLADVLTSISNNVSFETAQQMGQVKSTIELLTTEVANLKASLESLAATVKDNQQQQQQHSRATLMNPPSDTAVVSHTSPYVPIDASRPGPFRWDAMSKAAVAAAKRIGDEAAELYTRAGSLISEKLLSYEQNRQDPDTDREPENEINVY